MLGRRSRSNERPDAVRVEPILRTGSALHRPRRTEHVTCSGAVPEAPSRVGSPLGASLASIGPCTAMQCRQSHLRLRVVDLGPRRTLILAQRSSGGGLPGQRSLLRRSCDSFGNRGDDALVSTRSVPPGNFASSRLAATGRPRASNAQVSELPGRRDETEPGQVALWL